MKATCCWCGKGFVKIGHIYWCETEACRATQAEFAVTFHQDGRNVPFYVPLPKQIEFERLPVPFLLGGGAAGGSKSHQARYGLYRRAFQVPGFEALILRKNWNQLEKHHLRLMEQEAGKLRELGVRAEYLSQARELRIYHPNGQPSIIEGGHMADQDALDGYLSRERDAIVCDEGSTFDPKFLLELSTRSRSTKPELEEFAAKLWQVSKERVRNEMYGGAVFWVLSNPGGQGASMLRDMFIDKEPDLETYPQLGELDDNGEPFYRKSEWGFVPAKLEDNPYLPPGYERKLALTEPHRWKQLRYGDWDVLGGQFFAEFDSRLHVKDLGTPEGAKWFRSYDYGYIDNGVCLWWAVLPDGRRYVRAELKHSHWDVEHICREIHSETQKLGIGKISYTAADKFSMGMRESDKSGFSRGMMFSSYGVPVMSVSHDREQGWTRCRELLRLRSDGVPWVVFHPSCRYLIRSLSAATSDDKNPEDLDYSDDHALDAFRYGAMSMASPRERHQQKLPPHAWGHALRDLQSGRSKDPYAFH